MNRLNWIAITLAAAGLAGCGASALPSSKVAEPREAIRAASEMGADSNPQAQLHLKFAKDQVAKADQLLKDGDKDGATLALMQADADAELALELTKEEKMQGEAKAARAKIQDLQAKTQSNPTPQPMPQP